MCGIAGRAGRLVSDESGTVLAMLGAMAHRGPDDGGLHSTPQAVLGHRRLAIIDTDHRAAQPMVRGNLAIVFNGEIYNYIELRQALQALGHAFSTSSDTEVILAAYAQWGEACVERFDGMWAFALLDQSQGILFCSRDRCGEKPFLFCLERGRLSFASEAAALRTAGLGQQASRSALVQFLALGRLANTSQGWFSGIQSLPPSHNLQFTISTQTIRVSRYRTLGVGRSDPDGTTNRSTLDVMRSSVRMRLRSDVPVGMLLSGGIDSSLIAVLAGPEYRRLTGQRLIAITAASGDKANDESEAAEHLARSLDLDWHPVQLPHSIDLVYLLDATRTLQQPLPSLSMCLQREVFAHARRLDLKVVLDGQGADEVWLGYLRHRFMALGSLSPREAARRLWATRSSTDMSAARIAAFATYFNTPSIVTRRRYLELRRYGVAVDRQEISTWVRESMGIGLKSLNDVRANELWRGQLQSLLTSADMNSMGQSVEDRLPYLSPEVIQYASRLNVDRSLATGWSKYPLRKALADLGYSDVAWQKRKIGFEASTNATQRASAAVREIVKDSRLLADLGVQQRLIRSDSAIGWRFAAVALWEQSLGLTGIAG